MFLKIVVHNSWPTCSMISGSQPNEPCKANYGIICETLGRVVIGGKTDLTIFPQLKVCSQRCVAAKAIHKAHRKCPIPFGRCLAERTWAFQASWNQTLQGSKLTKTGGSYLVRKPVHLEPLSGSNRGNTHPAGFMRVCSCKCPSFPFAEFYFQPDPNVL